MDTATRARQFLERVLAIDSQSDERSDSVPSTPGQVALADFVGGFWAEQGARVERDAHANVLAWLPGRGALADAPTLAMLVHLDTAEGTQAVSGLDLHPGWRGERLSYSAAPRMRVDLDTYPSTSDFLGHDLLHGPGAAPFGLDDKLGLAHLMTLAWLLAQNPTRDHRPLVLVGRPDEEIGREEALLGLAAHLAEAGVTSGYTIDGFTPFEINVANFNAAQARVRFPHRALADARPRRVVRLRGVNTHGATASAEGHVSATQLAARVRAAVRGRDDVVLDGFASERLRECDGLLGVRGADLADVLDRVLAPHRVRGGGWEPVDEPLRVTAATEPMLDWIDGFLGSDPGFPLAAQDSAGWQGYSHPYRVWDEEDGLHLFVRIRDFDAAGLAARKAHVTDFTHGEVALEDQYQNMASRLSKRGDLIADAKAAAAAIGHEAVELPIRGGTGIDPFLDRGIYLANLGTGYFAPESEKEFTSLQQLRDHAQWLLALVTSTPGGAAST